MLRADQAKLAWLFRRHYISKANASTNIKLLMPIQKQREIISGKRRRQRGGENFSAVITFRN